MGVRSVKPIFLILSLFFASFSSADIGKKQFITEYIETSPALLCKTLTRCFTMTASECEKSLKGPIELCSHISEPQMPAVLTRLDGRKFGGVIGVCAMKNMIVENEKKLVRSKACNQFVIDAAKAR